MKSLFIIKTLLLAFTLSFISCGKKQGSSTGDNIINGSIVNGDEVKKGQWKSVVSLNTGGESFCTGNLVDSNTVYSAAHCFLRQEFSTRRSASYFRSRIIEIIEDKIIPGQTFSSLSKEDKIETAARVINGYILNKAEDITLKFGVGKRNGAENTIRTVGISNVVIGETYMKMAISQFFPEIKFTREELKSMGGRTAVDTAIITLSQPVTDIQPIPLVDASELGQIRIGQKIILTGFGAKVDPAILYYLDGKLKEIKKEIENETNHNKLLSLKKEQNQLVEAFRHYLGLARDESDKQIVEMEVKEEFKNTFVVADTRSGSEAGACHGDSGGPAFIQLPNGEWRQFAVIAQKYPLCHLGNLLMKVSSL